MPERTVAPDGAPAVAGKRGGEIAAYEPVPPDGAVGPELARRLIHGYYAAVSYADAQIGRVLDALDRLGLRDSTLVVLWGDNGFHLGDHGIWTKHTNYEQAARVPLLIAAPGITRPGSVTRQPAGTVDSFPTLCELAGLPAPRGPQPTDGISLLPVLRDPAVRVRDHVFHCYPKAKLGRAIRTERYRLVEWKRADELAETAELELYDYDADPGETRNFADELPAVVERLRRILAAYPPPAVPGARATPSAEAREWPRIAGRPLRIVVEASAPRGEMAPAAHGVLVAQGGRQHGCAVHVRDGQPIFDVRIGGRVTRLMAPRLDRPSCRIEAVLNERKMRLSVDGNPPARGPSPGLIPVQPNDGLSVGCDEQAAAGEYDPPNPFNGTILSVRIEADGPAPVARALPPDALAAGLAAHDRALLIHEAWIRDPFITVGPDGLYYLTGTTMAPGDPAERGDPYNSGLGAESRVGWHVRVWRSRDLIAWETLGSPFTLKDGVWFAKRRDAFEAAPPETWRLWAPELHWLGDRWALVHTSPSPVLGANLSLSAGPDPAGPWSNPMGEGIGRRHDPSLFKDDDGSVWLIWDATKIARLAPDFSGLATAPVDIGPSGDTAKMGHEGCLIMKLHGRYVLFGTGWSTGRMRRGSYNLCYATAERIAGPYGERKFAGRFLGHGTPFQNRAGRWWCTAFYNANVPPLPREGIETRDLSATAQTINPRGTTIVPMDVRVLPDGDLWIRARDPAYATPGPDEAQRFPKALAP